MPGVFICYRREDSGGWTGRIYDGASARFGSDRVFLDVEAIAPGENFLQAVDDALAESTVMLVVIGPSWLESRSVDGHRRLDDPSDFVRKEIVAALGMGLRIVPVLVDGAVMPTEPELPGEIKALASLNAVTIGRARFDDDLNRLLGTLGHKADMDSKVGLVRHNVPHHLTSFVGRAEELRLIRDLVDEHRLVTLTGSGGSGKTRLALQFASENVGNFPGGVWLVDLSSIGDPLDVPREVAVAVGVVRVPGIDTTVRLVERLAYREVLLVLDNCEHVLRAVGGLAQEILSRTDAVRVIATSRQSLGVRGEFPYQVPTLDTPSDSVVKPGVLIEYPAVRLFIDRAQASNPSFAVDEQNCAAVGEVCRRLDGLPLALELAAARLDTLSVEDLSKRLDHRFSLLTKGWRDSQSRQQTLAATVDWSYESLNRSERTLLDRLSVFRGGFTLRAVEQICAGGPIDSSTVLDLLSNLVDKSLVVAFQGVAARRFRLLETIREYGNRRLASANQVDAFDERHASYFHAFAVNSFEHQLGPDEVIWLDRLEEEWPNLRRALHWHADQGRDAEAAMMAGSLYRFFWRRYRKTEGVEWLERVVESTRAPSDGRARALHALATVSWEHDYLWDEAIELTRRYGSKADLARALGNAGYHFLVAGSTTRARGCYREAVDLARASGDPQTLSHALGGCAEVALKADDDAPSALVLYEEALRFAKIAGSPEWIASIKRDVGWMRRYAGDLDGAEVALLEAQTLEEQLGRRYAWAGHSEARLAAVALDRGDVDEARQQLIRFNRKTEAVRDDPVQWDSTSKPLLQWARVAVMEGKHSVATTLLAAHDHSTATQMTVPIYPHDRIEVDAAAQEARSHLSPGEESAAMARGRRMTSSEALHFATAELATSDERT